MPDRAGGAPRSKTREFTASGGGGLLAPRPFDHAHSRVPHAVLRLLADRFVRLDDHAVVDLATGNHVVFRITPAGTVADQQAWAERCAQRCAADNPRGVETTDYGLLDERTRFEAYEPRRGAEAGRDPARASAGGSRSTGALAIVERVAELLESGRPGEPRAALLTGPRGPTLRSVISAIARHARGLGFVPVASASAALAFAGGDAAVVPLGLRHVLLIHRNGPEATGSPRWFATLALLLGTTSSRPHLLLVVNERPDASLALAALDDGAWCQGLGRRSRLRHHAAKAMEGSFSTTSTSTLLARVVPSAADSVRHDPPQRFAGFCAAGSTAVAESHADYGGSADAAAGKPYPGVMAQGTGEFGVGTNVLAAAFDRWGAEAGRAELLIVEGRHAPAERLLRETCGALSRRGDCRAAGGAKLTLGRLLLHRGHAEEAVKCFTLARDDFARADQVVSAAHAAAWLGIGWTDQGRLADAEAALRSALFASAAVDAGSRAFATLGLVRCLYWQGRLDAAEALLVQAQGADRSCEKARPANSPSPRTAAPCNGGSWRLPDADVLAACLAARLAAAGRRWDAAGRAAVKAVEAARTSCPGDRARAETAKALVAAGTGDVERAREHVRAGLAEARRAHDPLRAVRLRLVIVEAGRPLSDDDVLGAAVAGLRRLRQDRLPPLLRARVQSALAASGAGDGISLRALVRSFVAMSGAHALEPPRQPRGAASGPDATGAIVALLDICQTADEEQPALERVAAEVRHRLRLAGLAVFGRDGDLVVPLAGAGGVHALDTCARRAMDRALPLPPEPHEGSLHAAVPVRYAGTIVGAVACRWPVDLQPDADFSLALLAAAAAACAPLVRALLDRRTAPPASSPAESELTGTSQAILLLRRAIVRAAQAPFPVLVQGESGSGKELVARAIHREGPRRHRKFCSFNCAALADDLVEAELFGHARGAFTGAVSERVGLFEDADGGTLFLDEVADLTARAQAKLLRVVQEGEVRRVGENLRRSIDVRLIAATNRPLVAEVQSGRFRADLLYRLDVIRLEVPPLRDRPEDIPLLAMECWDAAVKRLGSRATLAPTTLAALARYDWPGNVRELQNVMAALAVTAGRRGSVTPDRLPTAIANSSQVPAAASLDEARRTFETRFVRAALARAGGHRTRAAASLGLTRQGLAKLLARLRLDEGRGSMPTGAPGADP